MKKGVFVASIGIILLFLSFLWYQKAHSPEQLEEDMTVTLVSRSGEQQVINIELADDISERSMGLMGRAELEKGSGMLFVFEEEDIREFWMKDTWIPLDIMFFDAAGRFVSRTSMEPCNTRTCPTYPSAGPAMYALEVNWGEEKTAEIGDGWVLKLPLVIPSLSRNE